MVIRLRRVGEVADGSVTSEKLSDGAVDLSTAKVTGELPSGKLEDGAVIEGKLADLAVSTTKLQNAAVTLAKSDDDSRLTQFAGDETEVSSTGTDEIEQKAFDFVKVSGKFSPTKMRLIATLKTDDVLNTASLLIYIDDVLELTLTSTSTTYELVSGEIDVSALAAGKHTVVIKTKSSDAAGIAYNDHMDALFVK